MKNTSLLNLPMHRKKRFITIVLASVLFLIWYSVCLPARLFQGKTSTVLLDKDGNLLGAQIALDGQWRFSPGSTVPSRFEQCLLQFEDRNFYHHWGFSVTAIGRALIQNIRHKKVVSGGSTVTMQVIRIMRNNPRRTLPEKILEMILATRLELRCTKREILGYYASNAPFGNNVVGLDAASWRYFGRAPDKLSWAESATLAVLPNAPGLIYPGKNHQRLLEKRNRLLKRLFDMKQIDKTTFELALTEPLPEKPLPLPQLASHLLARIVKEHCQGQTVRTTLDISLQKKAAQLLEMHSQHLQENKIFNGAILITSVKTGQVLVYIGNTRLSDPDKGCEVDCIQAPRSTGSILKPFLYAKCLEDGIITPGMLIPDIPTQFGSFAPKNFSMQYDGAVPANKALTRSLNIPMVMLLNEYGLEKFHRGLKELGFSTFMHSSRHYGLSLILGGAEARLWDLNRAYTHLAQELQNEPKTPIGFMQERKSSPKIPAGEEMNTPQINKACIYKTFEALIEVNRPDEDGNWRVFASARKIAWKTGTSFGFRDAWAVGVTPDYVVSVWIGNAEGQGRPGLTGVKAAAPLLFDLFALLPVSTRWFSPPQDELVYTAVCHQSGHRVSSLCDKTDSVWLPKTCLNTPVCPYHQTVHLTKNGKERVESDCEPVSNMKHVTWFVLPPSIEKFYKSNHPDYAVLPDFKPGCLSGASDRAISVAYPRPNSKIYVPVEVDGTIGRTLFEATHRNPHTRIYWNLDDTYLGQTQEIHQMALNPPAGKHKLMLTDENGISLFVKFEIIGTTHAE